MAGYLGVGHGRKPDGKYDPGAVNPDGTQEHIQAHRVVEYAAQGLTRSQEPAFVERDSGAGHDPNYVGSIKAVNSGGYAWAVEVHFDSAMTKSGGFGLYLSEGLGKGQHLADAIKNRYASVGLATKLSRKRTDLGFLNRTHCVSVIWECDPVRLITEDEAMLMGEAIAAGICDWVKHTINPEIEYVPRSSKQVGPKVSPTSSSDSENAIKQRDAYKQALDDCRAKNRAAIAKIDSAKRNLNEAIDTLSD